MCIQIQIGYICSLLLKEKIKNKNYVTTVNFLMTALHLLGGDLHINSTPLPLDTVNNPVSRYSTLIREEEGLLTTLQQDSCKLRSARVVIIIFARIVEFYPACDVMDFYIPMMADGYSASYSLWPSIFHKQSISRLKFNSGY